MRHFHLHQTMMKDREHLNLKKFTTSKDQACQYLQRSTEIMMIITSLEHLADNPL